VAARSSPAKARHMDINQLLRAHQIALFGAARAPDQARRAAYDEAIPALATRIRRARKASGADVTAARFVVGEGVIAYRDR